MRGLLTVHPTSGLPVTIGAALLAMTLAPEAVAQSALPDPLAAGWDGAPVCERLHEDSSSRVLRCSFPPTVGHERHFHRPHFGYVLAGGRMRITDTTGTREVDLVPGRSTWSDGVAWHEVVNVGETTVVYLVVERKPEAADRACTCE